MQNWKPLAIVLPIFLLIDLLRLGVVMERFTATNLANWPISKGRLSLPGGVRRR